MHIAEIRGTNNTRSKAAKGKKKSTKPVPNVTAVVAASRQYDVLHTDVVFIHRRVTDTTKKSLPSPALMRLLA
jgi:hypothetical protein